MQISANGLDALKRSEGLRLQMYDDTRGACTVGYGHLVHKGRTGTRPILECPFVGGISENIAADLLLKDTRIAQGAVNAFVSVPLSQNQFDALVNLVYNIGGQAFHTSTLLKRLNAGDYVGAARQFDVWIHAGPSIDKGLVKRRARERQMFEGA